MNSSDLPKPWKYKNNWIIWPETILDILTVSDCNDTNTDTLVFREVEVIGYIIL